MPLSDTVRVREQVDIKEVNVQKVTDRALINQSPFAVRSIDIRKEYSKGGDIGEVMNRSMGMRLRSDGNIGAPVNINLGGLQGKAVRLFRDGIPIELYGRAFSLGMIPVNMLERVDIYNGVMPISIAGDALGGGVNMITRNETESTFGATYELASFNTHRATANLLWQDKKQEWYVGGLGSFNYSDNSYDVHVPVINLETGVATYKDLPRFHDAIRSQYVEGFVGVKNKAWADDLRLTILQSNFYKELQHDARMDKVFGEPTSNNAHYGGMLHYKKRLFADKLSIHAFGTYSYFNTQFVDTARVRYAWDQSIVGTTPTPGEINLGNNQHLDYHMLSNRLQVSYALSDRHQVDFSQMSFWQRRIGSDPLGAISALENIDVLSVPANYKKSNMGLGLTSSWLDGKLESVLGLKYYRFTTQGYATDNFNLGWRAESSDDRFGHLAGLRWDVGAFRLKTSYEYATRLPDEIEIFGDAQTIKENMELKPERSHNLNLGTEYNYQQGKQSFTASAGLFYRRVRDIIFLQLDIPFNRYINYNQSKIAGFETEIIYKPFRFADIGGNVTYQDIRRVNVEAMFRMDEGARVPNQPFFFGNLWANISFEDVVRSGDRISLNWNAQYTHRFYLLSIPRSQEPGVWEKTPDFQSSMVIPNDGRLGQWGHNAGVYYHLASKQWTLAAESRNIGNTRLYDNFSVQRLGRSFHIKLIYQLF
ncbi:TonB-dependent receptor plug domain-containing protein [Sphingobacterium corticis]|uniref:TonB-dependent receptor plug domain-containing protein n=1 Tax=Sphingobacterium corticis TaxID=1812823 RepID=A0ABW5NM63_9SPHI